MPHDVHLDRVYAARNASELSAEYDRISEKYDAALIEDHDWRMPEIMAGLVAWLLPRTARILDAACGTGLVGEHLKRFGFGDLHGLDLSPGMLAVAERKYVFQSLTVAALWGPRCRTEAASSMPSRSLAPSRHNMRRQIPCVN